MESFSASEQSGAGRLRAGRVTLSVDRYLNHHKECQEHLIEARKDPGHALCLCTHPARKLVLREVRGTIYLAVWPNDGHMHAPHCHFARDDAPEKNEAHSPETPKAAGKPRTAMLSPNGRWIIRTDWLGLQQGRNAQPSTSKPVNEGRYREGTQRPSTGHGGASLAQILDWVWEACNFNRWSDGWSRPWWRVRHSIIAETAAVDIDNQQLSEMLYVPQTFSMERRQSIEHEWTEFAKNMVMGDDKKPGLILAEIKRISESQFGYRVDIKNMKYPLFMDNSIYADLAKNSALPLALASMDEEIDGCVIGLFAVVLTKGNNLSIVDAALTLTNTNYIQSSNLAQVKFANYLCGNQRTFTKGMGDDVADFVILDTKPRTAVITTSVITPESIKKWIRTKERYKSEGLQVLEWAHGAGKDLPELPPRIN